MFSKITLALGLLIVTPEMSLADFPEKPSYANTIKNKSDKASKEVTDNEIDKNKENSRPMLVDKKEKPAEETHVIQNTHAGRLTESHKHLDKK